MKPSRRIWASVVAAAFAVTSAACSGACQNTADGLKKDAEKNALKARDAAGEAAKKATEAGAAAATQVATQVAAQVADQAGRTMAAAANTFDVKAALLADSTIDASNINVDTDGKTKTVTLKGSVPTGEQKAAAAQLAASVAAGYKVVNQLVVAKK